MNSTIAIVLARGGSRGVARKNARRLVGSPLIAHTIHAALQAELVDRVLVSTDDDEIATIATVCGAEVPFQRPSALATDEATSEQVLVHALDWLVAHEGHAPEVLVYLQSTNPFRPAGLIDHCVRRLRESPRLDSVFAAAPTHKKFWRQKDAGSWTRIGSSARHLPRQIDSEWLMREDTGIACATRSRVVLDTGCRLGDAIDVIANDDPLAAIDIDTEADWWLAETVARRLNARPEHNYCLLPTPSSTRQRSDTDLLSDEEG